MLQLVQKTVGVAGTVHQKRGQNAHCANLNLLLSKLTIPVQVKCPHRSLAYDRN